MAFFNNHSNLCKALRSKDANKYEAAMQDEYNLFIANNSWELTNLPNDCKGVGCKWVFHTKKDAWDEIVRRKARLIANEY